MQPESVEITSADELEAEREISARHLADFVRLAWHVLEPQQPYVHGWVIDAICEHLEAVTRGDIRRLLINVPPGMMKSLLVGVFWPAWEWGPLRLLSNRYLCASHSQNFAFRDNLRMRRLVFSTWFQERWPTQLQNDQDTKQKFETVQTGWRAACAMASMIGERGDRVILDDPHSAEGALSDADRTTTVRIFKETASQRVNNPDKSAIIVVMQRLHQEDVSGVIVDEKLGYEHLCLPMEYDSRRHCATSTGFSDPRTEDGELLFPERFPREAVEESKTTLGVAASGQLQQEPAPRGGIMIHVEKLADKIGTPPDESLLKSVTRYWDKAGTQGGGKRTAGVKIGKERIDLGDGRHLWRFWILDVVKGQWSAGPREQIIKQTAQLDGKRVKVYVEQEPGSGGKESAEATVSMLAGYKVEAERPSGDKALRAEPFCCQVDAGNVWLAEGAWNKEWLIEAGLFPLGRYKDQIDATSGAFNKCATTKEIGVRTIGDQPPKPQQITNHNGAVRALETA